MLQPIRISGARIPQPFTLDLDQVQEGGGSIKYVAPDGEVWPMFLPTWQERRSMPIILEPGGWSGGVADPEVTEVESVTRFGARTEGFRLPPFDGSLTVQVRGVEKKTDPTWRHWHRSWSPFEEGKMQVVGPGGNYWTPVVLRGFSDPEVWPSGRHLVRESVDWRARKGCWFGAVVKFTGTARVVVGGDVAPSVRLVWDGTATSFTLPNGQAVNLPAVREDGAPSPWTRAINLDRGMQGHVTVAASGATDGAAWSRLRGSVYGVTLAPHVPSAWVLGPGLTLEVTPRYLSPWR